MDLDRIRKSAEEYVNKSLQIIQESGSLVGSISAEKRHEIINATMRVAGFDVGKAEGEPPAR